MGKSRFTRVTLVTTAVLALLWLALYWYLRSPSLFPARNVTQELALDVSGIQADILKLTSFEPNRSYFNEETMLAAEELLASRFKDLGYETRRQGVHADGDKIFHNVIARYGDPNAKQVIVVGAHYDVAGDVTPGADDNASGIAGLLELARLLKTHKPSLPFPVELVAYTLEEPPFFSSREMGSVIHAHALKEAGIDVRLMLSFKMLGSYSDELFSQKYLNPILYAFAPWTGNYIAVVGRPENRGITKAFGWVMAANSTVPVERLNATPTLVHGSDYSSHRSYLAEGWPALMITDTSFYRYEHYHRLTDTPDKIDSAKIAQVIRGVYAALTSSEVAAEIKNLPSPTGGQSSTAPQEIPKRPVAH
jgi:Zn-dependent M28 family amino/carboxypeptidase